MEMAPILPSPSEAPGIDTVARAFVRYQEGHAALEAVGEGDQLDTVAEQQCWLVIDEADAAVQRLPAVAPADIASKLWIAIVHSTEGHEEESAAIRRDLDWFEERASQNDWNIRLIVSALRGLADMANPPADGGLDRALEIFRQASAVADQHHRDVVDVAKEQHAAGLIDQDAVIICGRENDRLGDISSHALADLEAYPVTSVSEWMRKVDLILEVLDEEDLESSIMLADLRRIAGSN